MENSEAVLIIAHALQTRCMQDCDPEWDNCRHDEAAAWLARLLKQVEQSAS